MLSGVRFSEPLSLDVESVATQESTRSFSSRYRCKEESMGDDAEIEPEEENECVCCQVRLHPDDVVVDPLSRVCFEAPATSRHGYLTPRNSARISYGDYSYFSTDGCHHRRVRLSCGHAYCARCFHRYVCTGEKDARLACVACGNTTELAREVTPPALDRFRLRSATSICVDEFRSTYLVVDSILNRCFEFSAKSQAGSAISSVKSHALLNGTKPTFGLVAMENNHVIATCDKKRSFLAFYSLKGDYIKAIYLPSGVVIKGLEKIYTDFKKSHVDFSWVLADFYGCRLLKVSNSDEVQSMSLRHLYPEPRIQALCTSASAPHSVYISDSSSGNILEVDVRHGCVLRSLGARLASACALFATPTRLIIADPSSACIRLLPTSVQICVTVDDCTSDRCDARIESRGTVEEEVDILWRPVQYSRYPCCLLRPVGVACFEGCMAVLLSAVGNVEISEVRFYRL